MFVSIALIIFVIGALWLVLRGGRVQENPDQYAERMRQEMYSFRSESPLIPRSRTSGSISKDVSYPLTYVHTHKTVITYHDTSGSEESQLGECTSETIPILGYILGENGEYWLIRSPGYRFFRVSDFEGEKLEGLREFTFDELPTPLI